VAAAVGALQRHLEKERSGKNALFDDDDMFSLVRFSPSPWLLHHSMLCVGCGGCRLRRAGR
jgi:hypothetical protein